MLAIAAELDYEVFMLDVQTAFLNADVEEDFFAKVAPGYEIVDKSGAYLVLQAQEEFVRSPAEPEEFVRRDGLSPRQNRVSPSQIGPMHYVFEDDSGFAIITLYVDDALLLGATISC